MPEKEITLKMITKVSREGEEKRKNYY